MKRYSKLYEQIISIENLRLADQKARRGKAHTYGVQLHDRHAEENILALHHALRNKTYKTSDYRIFSIYEPKERVIFQLPYYPDRIVHHAIMNILEPIWVKTFPYNTYSCIKGRGIEACAKRVSYLITKHKDEPRLYCLKTDITKYYPSIDHEVLKRIVRKKIKDQDLLWLIDEIIDSTEGLPIGNYLSQYLANLYLAYFMHHINSDFRGIDAVEYADDMVFLSSDKESLHGLRKHIEGYLSMELHLKLKGNYQVFPIARDRADRSGRALDFVGYKFFREQKLLRKSIKRNFCRAAIKARKQRLSTTEYKQRLSPYLGWAYHSQSRHLLKTIINNQHYESILRQQAC